jgi:hypothetical protein
MGHVFGASGMPDAQLHGIIVLLHYTAQVTAVAVTYHQGRHNTNAGINMINFIVTYFLNTDPDSRAIGHVVECQLCKCTHIRPVMYADCVRADVASACMFL